MASEAKVESLNLDNIQGDIWSKGFPKDNETYYLFQINPQRAKDFARNLKNLVIPDPNKSSLISSLTMVKKDWARIGEEKPNKVEMAHALIAFTFKGLEVVST